MGEDESICYALSSAVANFEDRRKTDLPSLNEVIDTDALESLFASRPNNISKFDGYITFKYSSSRVAIWVDRIVTIKLSSL
ncbi:MAG: HalOD1 output domain-containing protein [Halolamina sp.]